MDVLQDYSPYILHAYRTLNPYLQSAIRLLHSLQSQLTPRMLPLLDRLAVLAQDSPAIISIGLLLLLLVLSVQALNFARRVIVFWARMVFWASVYAGVAVLVAVVWQRGVGRTVGDLVAWAGEIQRVWWAEYRRWEGYGNHQHGQAKVRSGGGYGVRGGRAGTTWR